MLPNRHRRTAAPIRCPDSSDHQKPSSHQGVMGRLTPALLLASALLLGSCMDPSKGGSSTDGGTTWSQQAYVKAANNGAGDLFGFSVALDGDTLAVGAFYEDSNQTTITSGTTASSDDSNPNSRAVYVYLVQ